jgi:hypothetical protein
VPTFRIAPLAQGRPEINFNQGAAWKALISRYIGAIPLSGDIPYADEQSISGGPPPKIPVSRAIVARVGAAASDIQPAALSTGYACLSSLPFIGSTLQKLIQY